MIDIHVRRDAASVKDKLTAERLQAETDRVSRPSGF